MLYVFLLQSQTPCLAVNKAVKVQKDHSAYSGIENLSCGMSGPVALPSLSSVLLSVPSAV